MDHDERVSKKEYFSLWVDIGVFDGPGFFRILDSYLCQNTFVLCIYTQSSFAIQRQVILIRVSEYPNFRLLILDFQHRSVLTVPICDFPFAIVEFEVAAARKYRILSVFLRFYILRDLVITGLFSFFRRHI